MYNVTVEDNIEVINIHQISENIAYRQIKINGPLNPNYLNTIVELEDEDEQGNKIDNKFIEIIHTHDDIYSAFLEHVDDYEAFKFLFGEEDSWFYMDKFNEKFYNIDRVDLKSKFSFRSDIGVVVPGGELRLKTTTPTGIAIKVMPFFSNWDHKRLNKVKDDAIYLIGDFTDVELDGGDHYIEIYSKTFNVKKFVDQTNILEWVLPHLISACPIAKSKFEKWFKNFQIDDRELIKAFILTL